MTDFLTLPHCTLHTLVPSLATPPRSHEDRDLRLLETFSFREGGKGGWVGRKKGREREERREVERWREIGWKGGREGDRGGRQSYR